jgi:serine/threonine-protein kinase HipA
MAKPTNRTQSQTQTKIKHQRDCLQVWLGDSPVGSLFHQRGVYSFAYHPAWLRSPQRFWLDPELQLFTGEQYPASEGNFGVFLDSAPDRWGRLLMERREQLDAQAESRPARVLREWDFLNGVEDITRMGA